MKWLKRNHKREETPSIWEQQTQKLKELGALICAAREQQGYSLDDMVVLTKIPRRLLQAIEEGNLQELPEPIYVQGLLKQFADSLGINGTELASSFPVGTNRVSLKPNWKGASIGQLRPVHLYWLYIGLILCSVGGLSQLLNTATLQAGNTTSKLKQETTAALQKQPDAKAQAPKIIQTVSNTTSDEENRNVQVGVTLKEQSWIKVVADGKTTFEGVLPEGTKRVWKAQEQLTVRAGNAGGVMVSVNQEKAKQMGEPGQVEEVRIAAAKPKAL